jgi:DNA modification methylase
MGHYLRDRDASRLEQSMARLDQEQATAATGEAVYDPFLGSGTTLIAAERLGRRCYAMEIEPRYVQVAIERWQGFTGREAVRLDG